MLKKLSRLFITIILILTLSVTAFACTDDAGIVEETAEPIDKIVYNEGVHDFTAPDIEGEWLVKDGVTDYTIVLPITMDFIVTKALEEFKILFEKATNITTISVVKESDVTWTEDGKYISIAQNAFFESADIEFDPVPLKNDGTRIITKGKSIFLLGGPGVGVVYAVYDFMSIYFNFEHYYRNCMEIDTNVKNVPLKNFDVTNIPDIGYRTVSTGLGSSVGGATAIDSMALGAYAAQEVDSFNYRMREPHNGNSYLLPIYQDFYDNYSEASTSGKPSARIHNVLEYCPPGHPDCEAEWFSDGGNQLCYTARGNEESRDRMVKYCAAKICNSLEIFPRASSPLMNKVTLTIEDYTSHCNCTTCAQQMVADDNSRCGAIIRFCNEVRAIVDEWMAQPENEPYRRDTLELVFFAYSAIPNAPAHLDEETGEWVAAANCEMADGVGVYLATMGSKTDSIYHEKSTAYRQHLDSWSSLTDIVWLWTYAGHQSNCTYFSDVLTSMNNDTFNYFAAVGCEYWFDEKVDTGTNNTGFKKLEEYVETKLAWDCTLDMSVLIQNFFDAMFKDASDAMLNYYMELKAYHQSIDDWKTKQNKFTAEQYPYPVLVRWIGMLDKALADIEHYKESDPNLYAVVKDRIDCESVFPLFAIFEIHAGELVRPFSDEELVMWKARLEPIATTYVFSSTTELNPINAILEQY